MKNIIYTSVSLLLIAGIFSCSKSEQTDNKEGKSALEVEQSIGFKSIDLHTFRLRGQVECEVNYSILCDSLWQYEDTEDYARSNATVYCYSTDGTLLVDNNMSFDMKSGSTTLQRDDKGRITKISYEDIYEEVGCTNYIYYTYDEAGRVDSTYNEDNSNWYGTIDEKFFYDDNGELAYSLSNGTSECVFWYDSIVYRIQEVDSFGNWTRRRSITYRTEWACDNEEREYSTYYMLHIREINYYNADGSSSLPHIELPDNATLFDETDQYQIYRVTEAEHEDNYAEYSVWLADNHSQTLTRLFKTQTDLSNIEWQPYTQQISINNIVAADVLSLFHDENDNIWLVVSGCPDNRNIYTYYMPLSPLPETVNWLPTAEEFVSYDVPSKLLKVKSYKYDDEMGRYSVLKSFNLKGEEVSEEYAGQY